jgi:CRP/FNR family transcriptional regulator, cyclic AMP receptor protein
MNALEQNRHSLANYKIVQGLSPNHLETLSLCLTYRKIQKGEDLFTEGSEGESLFFLVEGSVRISQQLTLLSSQMEKEVREKALVVLSADSYPCFGEIGLLKKGVRTATVTALQDCALFELGHKDFLRLIQSEPDLGVRLILNLSAVVCSNLEVANRNILKLTTALSLALG